MSDAEIRVRGKVLQLACDAISCLKHMPYHPFQWKGYELVERYIQHNKPNTSPAVLT